MLCLPLTHSLTHSLTHDLSHCRARGRASERDQRQTEAGKGKRILTTTQQPNAANAWIIKLGSWKRETDTKKPTKTTLGFVFHKNSSTIMRAFVQTTQNHRCFSFLLLPQILVPLLVSSPSRGLFVLVLVSLFFFSFFSFFGWSEKSPKNDTVF
jgi:hypothetical protein